MFLANFHGSPEYKPFEPGGIGHADHDEEVMGKLVANHPEFLEVLVETGQAALCIYEQFLNGERRSRKKWSGYHIVTFLCPTGLDERWLFCGK